MARSNELQHIIREFTTCAHNGSIVERLFHSFPELAFLHEQFPSLLLLYTSKLFYTGIRLSVLSP